nr:esterase B1-like [Onthophagus taurus]
MTKMSHQVQTKQGVLEGKERTDFFGGKYYSFRGIPYAKPPVGKLRFKAPLPPEPWNGIRKAIDEQEGCYCFDTMEMKIIGKEDCLYLNVYTPQLPNGKGFTPKAVMVFIHGGGFTSGSPTEKLYGADYLVNQNVVLVTIAYRLGVLGFLSLKDPNLKIPGNAGMKDQVMALKWVQENIKSFGGDPGNVTIFGESAGGACVHYLIMSPMAKGLFHKAIIQSGTVMDPWTKGKPLGMEFCHYLDIDPSDENEMLTVLLKMPVEDLLTAQLSMRDTIQCDTLRYIAPVVEKSKKNAFLSEDPIDLLIQGKYNKVPILMGYNSKEGLVCGYLPGAVPRGNNLEEFIPYNMRLDRGSHFAMTIAAKLKEFYFPNDTNISGDPLYDLYTDTLFSRGIYKSSLYHVETSQNPVYLYKFSMDGDLNVLKHFIQAGKEPGACHGDELGYLFSNAYKKDVPKNSKEYKGILIMIHSWTNFAKIGNPNGNGDEIINVEWKPVTKDKINFMELDFDLKSGVYPDKERMELWNEIFKMKSHTMKY